MRIVVTGGAGFVGSNLALHLERAFGDAEILSVDNLKRRGSELALSRLRRAGVGFQHVDIRSPSDVREIGSFDVLVECSAEPSVHAGYGGSPAYLIDTNLVGTVNCLEAARACGAAVIFLSTSRVYPIQGLHALPVREGASRFELPPGASGAGWSNAGIAEEFPLSGHRSLYGTTKLASEMLLEEYAFAYGFRAIVNRCGVIAGPWQMGKVDQGFIVLWAARHLFGGSLVYMGYGGRGLQVRDVLHVDDLCDLVVLQLRDLARYVGATFNVGGGHANSVSLAELTAACTGRSQALSIGRDEATRQADIPYYVTDNSRVTAASGWMPRRSVGDVLDDVFRWLRDHRSEVEPVLGA